MSRCDHYNCKVRLSRHYWSSALASCGSVAQATYASSMCNRLAIANHMPVGIVVLRYNREFSQLKLMVIPQIVLLL